MTIFAYYTLPQPSEVHQFQLGYLITSLGSLWDLIFMDILCASTTTDFLCDPEQLYKYDLYQTFQRVQHERGH